MLTETPRLHPQRQAVAHHQGGPEGPAQAYAPAAQVEIEAAERGIPADLGPGAPVDRMREHLRDKRGGSTSGTKKELWDRIMKLDNERKAKFERDKFVQRRRDELQVADQPVAQHLIPEPKAPTAAERAAHSITHYPPEPWCELCTMGRGKDDPHFRVDFDNKDKKLPIIACDFAQLRGDGEDGGAADSVWSHTIVTLVSQKQYHYQRKEHPSMQYWE